MLLWSWLPLLIFRLLDSHYLWFSFPTNSSRLISSYCQSSTPNASIRFGLFLFRSPLLKESLFTFFSCRYLDVSVPCVPLHILFYSYMHDCAFTTAGFPHSDTHGSIDICSSPWLFAAYRVLLRLLVPRHPPFALFFLIFLGLILSYLLLYSFQCTGGLEWIRTIDLTLIRRAL